VQNNYSRSLKEFPNLIGIQRHQSSSHQFYSPTCSEIECKRTEIREFLKNEFVLVILPIAGMRELPNIMAIIHYLLERFPPKMLVIVCPGAIADRVNLLLESSGTQEINLVVEDQVYQENENFLRQTSLYSNFATMRGKGRGFYAAIQWIKKHECQNFPHLEYIAMIDGDGNIEEYNPIDFILYPIIENLDDQISAVWTAQAHVLRENWPLTSAMDTVRFINGTGRHYASHFSHMVWRLSGENLISWNNCKDSLCFSMAYGLETVLLMSLFDFISEDDERKIAQVANPNIKVDGRNGSDYNQIMYHQLLSLLINIVLENKKLCEFDMNNFDRVNHRMKNADCLAIIPNAPQDHGPNIQVKIEPDLLIPSFNQMNIFCNVV